MTTVTNIFAFALQRYNVILKHDASWKILASHIHLMRNDKNTLLDSILVVYPRLVQTQPQLAPLMDDLFAHMALDTMQRSSTSFRLTSEIGTLFNAWTQCGTRDIPKHAAAPLVHALKKLVSKNDRSYYDSVFIGILIRSPTLWAYVKKDFLDYTETERHPNYSLLQIMHRYVPEHSYVAKAQECEVVNMYEDLCGSTLDVKPTLKSLTVVLKESHSHALSWHIALAICAPQDPTIAGNWMHMLDTFSSLTLEPCDRESWEFWHLLRDNVKDDASGRNLLSCLADTKHEMASAFANGWSIVDALYADDERYIQASLLYQQKPVPLLSLPDVCTRSCFDA